MFRGNIWWVDLDPTTDAEIGKTRPSVIVNDDAIGILPLRIVVPLTDWKASYALRPWMVRIEPEQANGLTKRSAADAFQVQSVSKERFKRQIGKLFDTTMYEISRALSIVLSIEPDLLARDEGGESDDT